jgi:hypothetical protein
MDIEGLLFLIIKSRIQPDALGWLETRSAIIRRGADADQLSIIFAQIPRFITKELVGGDQKEVSAIKALVPGYDISFCTMESLCRIWILLQVPDVEEMVYLQVIESLFSAAEMNELVALYKALPVLAFPDQWVKRCEEGIRSNIGLVLEAIMYHNPFPATYLSENAWNQMILKAFFTEKDVTLIYGLWERKNPALITTLEDYVKERQAAGRTVNAELHKIIMNKVF